VLDNSKPIDAGLYKCRVDFKIQPTTISHVNLTVNTPPGKPVIYEGSGREVRLKLGPYRLGEAVTVKCLVVGGRPSPSVTWWRDHHLVDDTFSAKEPGDFKVENLLSLPSLQRSDVNSILTCQAKNNNNSVPVSTSVKLDMTFGPERLTIRRLPHSLSAGEKYMVECEAVGSRPPPVLSWRLGDADVTVLQTELVTSNDGNITRSTISLEAEARHHGLSLSCHAHVPGLEDDKMEASSSLNVHFIQSASLRLGSSIAGERVREGDDVYLECGVEANPRPERVTWYREGIEVKQEVDRGVILSNLTLVLQRVTRETRGEYTCRAANTEGSVRSNVLQLDIQYKPVCALEAPQEYEVGLNVQSEVVCKVEAAPDSQLTFHWVFNTSKEMIDIQHDQMRVNGSVSTVDYIPRTPLDYGSLLCWASNEVGAQSQPCVFHLSPARPPAPVSLCSVSHEFMTSVRLRCESESEDTDREAVTFLMEVWRIGGEEHKMRNLTSVTGDWSLDGLEPGQEYGLSVRTRNSAGISPRYNTTFLTYESELAQSRVHIDSTDPGTGFVITPILGALIGVGVALSFVTVTILIVVFCKTKRRTQSGSLTNIRQEGELLSPDMAPRKIVSSGDDDDEDDSGFGQLYSDRQQRRYSSLNRQLCNKNIFIVGPSASQAARHNDAGYSCDPRTHYSTLQPRAYSARPGQYDPSQARCCNTYTSVTLQQSSRSAVTIQGKYHQHNPNIASKHNHNSPSPGGDEEVQMPLLSSSSSPTSGPTISTVSSTVSSSELNHSLTSSDASEFSSERDRESEV